MKRLTKKVGDYYCSQRGDFYDLYNKIGKLEDLEEEIDVDLIEFLSESIYVLKHSNQIAGYTSKGKEIHTDFGYVEEFIEDLKEAIKGEKN